MSHFLQNNSILVLYKVNWNLLKSIKSDRTKILFTCNLHEYKLVNDLNESRLIEIDKI